MAVFVKRDRFILKEKLYTRLKYITSDGYQYIDTNFIPKQNTRVVLDIDVLSEKSVVQNSNYYPGVFGARAAANKNQFCLWLLSNYRDYYANEYIQTTPSNLTGRFLIDKNKNVTNFNNEIINTHADATFNSACNLTLLAVNTGGTVDVRRLVANIYSCKIYNNDVLIREYIPVKLRKTGECGLWDLVEDAFYGNKGTGTFTGGVA